MHLLIWVVCTGTTVLSLLNSFTWLAVRHSCQVADSLLRKLLPLPL